MITLKALDKVIDKLNNLNNLKNDIEKEKPFIMEEFLEDFRKYELPEIAKSEGSNIGLPFREKKVKYGGKRLYEVPSGFFAGVSTGETYYALEKCQSTKGRKIIKSLKNGELIYGYEAKEDINFNLGLSTEFLENESKKIKARLENMVRLKIV